MVNHILEHDPDLQVVFPAEELAISREQLRNIDPELLRELFLVRPGPPVCPFSIASEAADPHGWFCDVQLTLRENGHAFRMGHSTLAHEREAGLQTCYKWILKGLIHSHGTTSSDQVTSAFLARMTFLRAQRKKLKKARRPRVPRPDVDDLVPCLTTTGQESVTLLALPESPNTPCAARIGDGPLHYLKCFALPKHGDAFVFADYGGNVFLLHCSECNKPIVREPGGVTSVPVHRWFGVVQRRLLCTGCLSHWKNRLEGAPGDDEEEINNMHLHDFLDRPRLMPQEKPSHAGLLVDLTVQPK